MSKVLLFDGSFSVELKRRGYDCHNKPLWSFSAVIEAPDVVKDVHRGFIEFGCEMITTNTYHASIPLMDKQYDTKKQEDLISLACDLATNAARESGKQIDVWASIGSYGVQFRDASEYNASYLEKLNSPQLLDVMSKYYLEHMQLIVEKGGMNQLIIETLPSLSDAKAVRVAAQELHKLHPNVVLIVSFTCKIIGIAINCTHPQNVSPALETIGIFEHKFKHVIVYPNMGFVEAGETYTKF
ncbi:hypothetical protein WR25_23570 [Diploscapter pachys]|uniref:Hcy-binding domain-containing protein n=1 Tax=Diploscapter pachys TaxID=2018661 RepID=A0A2A2JFH9_9BILA|nr:hypothetical protein WR25_23570 [Diploscapter pachys]